MFKVLIVIITIVIVRITHVRCNSQGRLRKFPEDGGKTMFTEHITQPSNIIDDPCATYGVHARRGELIKSFTCPRK